MYTPILFGYRININFPSDLITKLKTGKTRGNSSKWFTEGTKFDEGYQSKIKLKVICSTEKKLLKLLH